MCRNIPVATIALTIAIKKKITVNVSVEAYRRNLGRAIRGHATEGPLHALNCIALHSSGIGK
jgi:hypothetical protein